MVYVCVYICGHTYIHLQDKNEMLAFVVNRNVGRGFFGGWLKSLCKEQLNSGCNPYCKLFGDSDFLSHVCSY